MSLLQLTRLKADSNGCPLRVESASSLLIATHAAHPGQTGMPKDGRKDFHKTRIKRGFFMLLGSFTSSRMRCAIRIAVLTIGRRIWRSAGK